MANEKLTPGHYDELVERLQLLSYFINRQIKQLPVVYQNKEWLGYVSAIHQLTETLESIARGPAANERRFDDLAFALCETIYDHLSEDEALTKDKKASALVEKAGDALWKLYQYCAQKHHTEDANTKPKPNKTRKGVHKGA